MTETSNADKLRISDGFVVWIIGRTVEETALLDPLPEGAETIEHRDEDEPDTVDAAILFVDTRADLVDQLDDVIPQLGSIPVVWICFPRSGGSGLGVESVDGHVADYGWHVIEEVPLDDTWTAVRLQQS